jgi:hypothetical protein
LARRDLLQVDLALGIVHAFGESQEMCSLLGCRSLDKVPLGSSAMYSRSFRDEGNDIRDKRGALWKSTTTRAVFLGMDIGPQRSFTSRLGPGHCTCFRRVPGDVFNETERIPQRTVSCRPLSLASTIHRKHSPCSLLAGDSV